MTFFLKKHIHLFTHNSNFFIFTVALFLVGCGSNLERIPAEQVDTTEKQFAEQMANMILSRCLSYDYSALPLEQTNEAMIKGFDAGIFQQTCELLKNKYGKFRSMEFVEAMQQPESNEYTIYRFKGNFKSVTVRRQPISSTSCGGTLPLCLSTKWGDNV